MEWTTRIMNVVRSSPKPPEAFAHIVTQPVLVKNWPAPDATSLRWAEVAVAVALVTLFFVWRQICLAKKALKLTKEALDLAVEELRITKESNDLVREDLAFSRTQTEYLNRHAELFVSARYRDIDVHQITVPNENGKGLTHHRLFLSNDGLKTARDATLLLWIPTEFDPIDKYDLKHPDQRFGAFGFKYIANVEVENKKRYWHMTYDVPFPIYPGAPSRLVVEFRLWVPVPTADFILWRATYDDGIAPPLNQPHGRIGVTTIRAKNIKERLRGAAIVFPEEPGS